MQDVVRGVGTDSALITNETYSEAGTGYSNAVTAFDSNGFTLGGRNQVNYSGDAFVAWNWKAGGAGVSNTDGSITSTVSANPTAGFSVVTYTGNGTSGATVGHGLGVAPSLIFAKNRTAVGSWHSYHVSLGGTQGILLNSTNAASTDAGFWNNTNPSATVFTVGTYNTFNTQTYLAYCFAAVAGYSAFGSYTGNGSTDAPFVYLGFRPRFVMIKSTGSQDWVMLDSSTNASNVAGNYLRPNSSGAENGG